MNELLEVGLNVGDISIHRLACRARNHFDLTFRNLLANVDPVTDSHQIVPEVAAVSALWLILIYSTSPIIMWRHSLARGWRRN